LTHVEASVAGGIAVFVTDPQSAFDAQVLVAAPGTSCWQKFCAGNGLLLQESDAQ
jgi:hypothetical protein